MRNGVIRQIMKNTEIGEMLQNYSLGAECLSCLQPRKQGKGDHSCYVKKRLPWRSWQRKVIAIWCINKKVGREG